MGIDIADREAVLRELATLKPQLEARYGVTRIGVFGSAARDELRKDSDIDIVVEMKEPDLFYLVHIKETLEEEFGHPVDIIHFRERMNEFLKQRIQREALYV